MKQVSKYYCSGILVCLAAILIGCGEQATQSSSADFINYLETGEMKMADDKGGGGSGGDMCTSRVTVDGVCSDFGGGQGSFSTTRQEAESSAMAQCEEARVENQNEMKRRANVEKEACEKDANGDGTKDCDFWTSEKFPPCILQRSIHLIDGGGTNPDTICTYFAGRNDGTCEEKPSNYNVSDYWFSTYHISPQCIKVSCKR